MWKSGNTKCDSSTIFSHTVNYRVSSAMFSDTFNTEFLWPLLIHLNAVFLQLFFLNTVNDPLTVLSNTVMYKDPLSVFLIHLHTMILLSFEYNYIQWSFNHLSKIQLKIEFPQLLFLIQWFFSGLFWHSPWYNCNGHKTPNKLLLLFCHS